MMMIIFEWVWVLPLVALYIWWCVKAVLGVKQLIRMYNKGWSLSFILNHDDEVMPFVAWVVVHTFVVSVISFAYWLGILGGTL